MSSKCWALNWVEGEAGAVWEQSISEEMTAVTRKYRVRIDNEPEEINRKERRLAELRARQ